MGREVALHLSASLTCLSAGTNVSPCHSLLGLPGTRRTTVRWDLNSEGFLKLVSREATDDMVERESSKTPSLPPLHIRTKGGKGQALNLVLGVPAEFFLTERVGM